MTVNQITVHPSTALIPAPKYNLGQEVKWTSKEHPEVHNFKGIVIEQVYRVNHKGGYWQFTTAITLAKVAGLPVDWYAGEYSYDLEENDLNTCENEI